MSGASPSASPDERALPSAARFGDLPADGSGAAGAALEEAVGLAFRVLKGLMLVVLALFLGSGVFVVPSHEVAFVRRLGVLRPEPLEAGLHWRWPVGEDVITVPLRARSVGTDAFDLALSDAERMAERLNGEAPRRSGGVDPSRDGYLLSGDGNLLHATLSARLVPQAPYQRARLSFVDDAAHDRDRALQVLFERAALQAAAHRPVEGLLGAGNSSFRDEVGRELGESLERLDVGLAVQGIVLERDLRAPPQTGAAFDAVARAGQEVDTLRSEAATAANALRSAALSQAGRIEREAAARAARIVADARADRQALEALSALRRAGRASGARRGALEDRLLAETLAKAFGRVGEVFLVGEGELRVRLERDESAIRRQLERRGLLGEDEQGAR